MDFILRHGKLIGLLELFSRSNTFLAKNMLDNSDLHADLLRVQL